jgi:deazaflavin-dependent oxidoreductase (nitroreductase family)
MRDGDAYVVVASNGGSASHPAWWLNLTSEPSATIQVRDARLAVRAEEAPEDERARLWPMLTSAYAGYDQYAKETTRRIPVVILRPRADGTGTAS